MPEYIKVYTDWQNSPSTATPITATALETIETGIANANRDDTENIRALGHQGNSTTTTNPADAEFYLAQLAAKNASRTSTGSDPYGTLVIEIPAGDYLITELMGLLGREAKVSKTSGLRFVGAGMNLTNIIFNPASAGALVFNDYWLNISFEHMTFTAADPDLTFMRSYTTHNAQQYTFFRVKWTGGWKYCFDLQGDNNNSEYSFYSCDCSGQQANGAFFYAGALASDQFLNYWFYGIKFWSTSAPFIDSAKGGHYHIFGLDASDWGNALAAPGKLFYLRGTSHAQGVTGMSVHGLRMEIKNNNGGILYSEWPSGNVSFDNVDVSSQFFVYNAMVEMFHFYVENTSGSIYHITNARLAGTVKVTYGSNQWAQIHKIIFENCSWEQKLSPTDVVVYDSTTLAAGTYNSNPEVHFINCRNASYRDPYEATNGIAVWDAVVGWGSGNLVSGAHKRHLKIQDREGLNTSGNYRFVLPLGAIITGFSGIIVPGASAQGSAAAWTLRTNEATPQVISTITTPGTVNAGMNVSNQLATPWYCNTDVKRKLSVANTTALTGKTRDGWLWVEGYW